MSAQGQIFLDGSGLGCGVESRVVLLIEEHHSSVSQLHNLSGIAIHAFPFRLDFFIGIVQGVSEHRNHSGGESDGFFSDQPKHMFGARRLGVTAHIFVITEGCVVHDIVFIVMDKHERMEGGF